MDTRTWLTALGVVEYLPLFSRYRGVEVSIRCHQTSSVIATMLLHNNSCVNLTTSLCSFVCVKVAVNHLTPKFSDDVIATRWLMFLPPASDLCSFLDFPFVRVVFNQRVTSMRFSAWKHGE